MKKKKQNFLLLELMIALFLIGMAALPLTHLMMKGVQEEIKRAYRLQLRRLSDEACAEIKAQLYRNEIEWKEFPGSRKSLLLTEKKELSLGTLGKRVFERKCYLSSHLKKGKAEEEHRLVTLSVKLSPLKKVPLFTKKKKSALFSYDFYLIKKGVQQDAPSETPVKS